VQTSVPPEVEKSQMSEPTASYTHANPSGDSGDPVEPTACSRERSCSSAGRSPAFWQFEM